jgi:hypothetical protein
MKHFKLVEKCTSARLQLEFHAVIYELVKAGFLEKIQASDSGNSFDR